MKLSKRSSNIDDDEVINEFLRNENYLQRKTKMTDLLCSLINYISLVPSLFYNAVWFFYLKSTLELLGSEEPQMERTIEGCSELYHWINYSLTLTILSFLKSAVLLVCIKCCCGNENECNLCCLLIKSVSSVIPSIVFVLKLPDYVNNYRLLNSNVIDISTEMGGENMKALCDQMAHTLNSYYIGEYSYVLFVLFIFCIFPLGAICTCMKEIWKSRNYHKED